MEKYFSMAMGVDGFPALDLLKLFGTNYHYLVQELKETKKKAKNLTNIKATKTQAEKFSEYLNIKDMARTSVGLGNDVPLIIGIIWYENLSNMDGFNADIVLAMMLPSTSSHLRISVRRVGHPISRVETIFPQMIFEWNHEFILKI